MKTPLSTPRRPRYAFTLVEAMISLSIACLLMAGLLSFYQDSTVVMYDSEKKSMINSDMRDITNEMTVEARNANHFVMYESFSHDFRSVPTDVTQDDDYYYDPNGWDSSFLSSGSTSEAGVPDSNVDSDFDPLSYYRKRDGESGDFLLLITYGDDLSPYDTNGTTVYPDDVDYSKPITKLVGYYRIVEDSANQTGPVRKFTVYPTGSDRYKSVEELIPSSSTAGTHPIVIELSKGLANQRLFYNYHDSSIMVNGQIIHGTSAKRITDTYNFTISPRGIKHENTSRTTLTRPQYLRQSPALAALAQRLDDHARAHPYRRGHHGSGLPPEPEPERKENQYAAHSSAGVQKCRRIHGRVRVCRLDGPLPHPKRRRLGPGFTVLGPRHYPQLSDQFL